LNVLEEFLDKFGGCLLLVSHDRYFMDHLVEELFVFEGDGKITSFNGNYTDYRDWLDEQEEQPVVEVKEKKVEPKTTSNKKEKKEYEQIQQEIDKLEQEKRLANEQLNDSTLSHQQLTDIGKRIEQITQQIDSKTTRWLELDEILNS
jgi:ATP-binding cassette subfamily F protein uup